MNPQSPSKLSIFDERAKYLRERSRENLQSGAGGVRALSFQNSKGLVAVSETDLVRVLHNPFLLGIPLCDPLLLGVALFRSKVFDVFDAAKLLAVEPAQGNGCFIALLRHDARIFGLDIGRPAGAVQIDPSKYQRVDSPEWPAALRVSPGGDLMWLDPSALPLPGIQPN